MRQKDPPKNFPKEGKAHPQLHLLVNSFQNLPKTQGLNWCVFRCFQKNKKTNN